MKVNVLDIIKQLSKERGVDTDVIVNAIKESLKVVSSNYFVNNEEEMVNLEFLLLKKSVKIRTIQLPKSLSLKQKKLMWPQLMETTLKSISPLRL